MVTTPAGRNFDVIKGGVEEEEMEHYEYNGVLTPEPVILFKAALPIHVEGGVTSSLQKGRLGEGGGAGVGGGGEGGILLKESHISVPALPLGVGLLFGFHANNWFD